MLWMSRIPLPDRCPTRACRRASVVCTARRCAARGLAIAPARASTGERPGRRLLRDAHERRHRPADHLVRAITPLFARGSTREAQPRVAAGPGSPARR
jgi:hypothetical protein